MILLVKFLQNNTVIGILSSGVGALLNIAGVAVLAFLLSEESLAEFRAYINISIYAGILLCLGWDTLIVKLTTSATILLVRFFFITHAVIILLAANFISSYWSILNIAVLSLLISFPIINFNAFRSIGMFAKYFVGINIIDKTLRLVAIGAAAFLTHDHFSKNLIIFLTIVNCINFSLFLYFSSNDNSSRESFRHDVLVIADAFSFIQYAKILIGSVFMIMISRGIYFAVLPSFAIEKNTIDLSILFASFLFVPIQASLKIEEAKKYQLSSNAISFSNLKQSYFIVIEISLLIAMFISLFLYVSLINIDMQEALVYLVFLSLIIYTLYPGLFQILVHDPNRKLFIYTGVYLAICFISYVLIFKHISLLVPLQLFLLLLYCLLVYSFARERDELNLYYIRLFRSFVMMVIIIALGMLI
jgi:hypothetical protein